MNQPPSLEEITNAYNVGKDDGKAIGYAIGVKEEQRKKDRKVTALGWLCLIELFFIGLILLK